MALKQANTLAPSNVSATGFALADARHIGGHRVVASLAGLYALQDWQLLNPDETDTDLALGQQWYVKGTGFYRLTNWGNRKAAAGWTRVVDPNNIDTTLFEIVSSLPQAVNRINKNRIYLVKVDSKEDMNVYAEFVYTGDTSAAYDASKWEKLGEYKPEVDLTPYAKTADVDSAIETVTKLGREAKDAAEAAGAKADNNAASIATINGKLIPATAAKEGFMSASDKSTLDALDDELTSGERNNVLAFSAVISGDITVLTSTATGDVAIVYSTVNNTFVATDGKKYFSNWNTAYKYGKATDLGRKPSEEKLYNFIPQSGTTTGLGSNFKKGYLYRYNGVELVTVNNDVDTSLSASSDNAVANKTVKAALDKKVDTSTYNSKVSALEAKNSEQDTAIAAKVDKADIEVMTTAEVDALFA